MITKADLMAHLGTAIAGLTVVSAMFQSYFPCELRGLIMASYEKFVNFVYPYIQITFLEYPGDYGFERNKAYAAIERYLNTNSTIQAKRLQANVFDDSEAIVFSVANNQEVTDEFEGIKLWWTSSENTPNKQSISFFPRQDEKRYFKLTFYRKHREIIAAEYLKHVLEKGKAITVQERLRKLYTNNKGGEGYGFRSRSLWSHVVFEHPATFDTLAMDPDKKQGIINDLLHFSKSKHYYAKMGKAWKRGYLLYGPPGTGKSTMIAAMANLLKYDVYDLELTAVRDNTELRKLLIDTSSKSVIVIEDIDCSLDLTGQRDKKKDKKEEDEKKKDHEGTDPVKEKMMKEEENKSSQVTLSGLLNTIDGLWSACPGERIIVFTTNHVEKLDPALIRRGRMDKHIKLSYCGFEAFKALARNYLDIDSHRLFATISRLLEETNMTPADVADNLMLRSDGEDGESNLMRLIKAMEDQAKEEARLKAEEEEKQKAEKLSKEENKAKEEENGGESADQNIADGVKENGGSTKANTENLENGVIKQNGVAAK